VIGQQLTAIKFDVHWLSRKINGGEEAKNKFTGTMELIDDTIQGHPQNKFGIKTRHIE
jgi:hypothetical protein